MSDDARRLLIELAARWVTHSGLCCVMVDGKCVVTEESCKCDPLERRIHAYLGTFCVSGIRDLAARDKVADDTRAMMLATCDKFIAEHQAAAEPPADTRDDDADVSAVIDCDQCRGEGYHSGGEHMCLHCAGTGRAAAQRAARKDGA